MKSLFPCIFLALLGSVLFSACAKRTPLPAWFLKLPAMKNQVGPEEIFKLPEGERISFDQFMNELSNERVIYVGENHDQMEHHEIQVRVIQGLLEKGKDLVVAMEMFERTRQPVLDRWSQGLLSEEEFINEVDWDASWGTDYHLYKGILDQVKEHHLKLLGLNVPRELVRKVALKGIEGLSPEDRATLPEMDLTDWSHRAYIAFIFKAHRHGSAKGLDYFYQAQSLWDEGMAETLAGFLRSPEGEGKTAVVFAGNGHVVFDFGIPKRLYRRIAIPFKTLALKEWKKEMDEDLTFSGGPSSPADFIWITRPAPPEKKRPRIGVVLSLREDPKGIGIERVVPESPAEKAGLLPGDQFVAVEGTEIKTVKDIHNALEQKGWGKEITFTILRDGSKREITVTLPPLAEE
jgi:uncharacterized iron-regulated protein